MPEETLSLWPPEKIPIVIAEGIHPMVCCLLRICIVFQLAALLSISVGCSTKSKVSLSSGRTVTANCEKGTVTLNRDDAKNSVTVSVGGHDGLTVLVEPRQISLDGSVVVEIAKSAKAIEIVTRDDSIEILADGEQIYKGKSDKL